MEIKNNNKVLITGSHICLAVGILSIICAVYWLIQAFFYDNVNLLMLVISSGASIAGISYGLKRE